MPLWGSFRFRQNHLDEIVGRLSYRPQQGNILYNGIDENDINYEDLRNQIGFVTQDTQLFSGHY